MKFLVYILSICSLSVWSQQNLSFKNEVSTITKKYETLWNADRDAIVFTGSSSIKMWNNIPELFPDKQIINTGFGGSQAIDLLGYTDELILNYQPKKVFIYEGDNDISAKKKPKEIIKTLEQIIAKIKNQNNTTSIIIISAKPSIARYHLKNKYVRLNRKMNRLCKKDPVLEFANVWDIMFEKRKLKAELFLTDGLHMNANGYELWHSVIKNHIN
jgi:lysophospholipase L1-like esterase